MFNFHTHINSKNAIINIDDLHGFDPQKNYYYSLGNHPWKTPYSLKEIELAINKISQIIAVGECGIDKLKSPLNLNEQVSVLKDQILLSEYHQLPLILHIVKGFNEIIKLKKEFKPTQTWIIHGFNNYKQTQPLLNAGFYLSFGPQLLTNLKLQQAYKTVPLDKIVFETDDTTISIEKIYTFAAQLKNIELLELNSEINKNLRLIFNGKLVRET
jgi:TatD DNase family protein